VLIDVQSREVLEVRRMNLLYQVAMCLAVGSQPGVDVMQVFESCDPALTEYRHLLLPWLERDRLSGLKRTLKDLEEGWKATYGDWNDPEVRREIDEACRALLPMPAGRK
jgi:hypothetical protein